MADSAEKKEFRRLRKESEKGIWKKYTRLVFKAKLPWKWLAFLVVINIGSMQLSLMFPQYAQKISSGVLTNTVIFGAIAVIMGAFYLRGL
ncbi:hypothetical protein JNUCC1_02042 [Lentibacillus sp. JNUCC-1]|uniref:hypothetical protein n=1 Tax=Lentibacillus sp. JNUCC-1 TaxID=2654513 RepID=UPI0012E82597|nr:hypothetical protein [Lentibacillus sp. JNUCC-1]MUV38206.1 hypothetical protein [Lentibacillus sp. JNUCC-1]